MPNKTGKERLAASKERRRQLNKERARRFYAKRKKDGECQAKSHSGGARSIVTSRQARKRTLDRVREALPRTPEKKAKIVETLLESPETKALLGNVTENRRNARAVETATAVLQDVRDAVSTVKNKRSNDARITMNVGIPMVCGGNVLNSGLQIKVSSELGISKRRIAICLQHRKNVMSETSTTPWTLIQRQTRNDATEERDRKLAHDFWYSPGISRPTGNKRDVTKKRIGPNQYIEHEKYVLEKTQTEVYHAFKQEYPDVKMGQRYFENCKPFFVIPARMKDRNSCCCRSHVEIQMVFKHCMDYRKTCAPVEGVKIFSHLSDLVSDTLCPLTDDSVVSHKKRLSTESVLSVERISFLCFLKKRATTVVK